jgi:hypothetical protein
MQVSRGTGDFTLIASHPAPGRPFLTLRASEDDMEFASLWFGTKEETALESEMFPTNSGPPVVEREVNKLVTDFPATPDLSTPESAYAALEQAFARKDIKTIGRISTFDMKQHGDWFQREQQRDSEGMGVYAKAKILTVQTYRDDLADVIAYIPFPEGTPRSRYDAEFFGRVNGEWRNVGSHGRFLHLVSARADFCARPELFWMMMTNNMGNIAASAAERENSTNAGTMQK